MTTLRLTPKARSDLDTIWDYTAKTWGQDQAEAYLLQAARLLRCVPMVRKF